MRDIPIAGKFAVLIAIFGILNIAAVMWSSAQMRGIDSAYVEAIHVQGEAAIFASRANRALSTVKAAIGDLEIAQTAEDDKIAVANIKTAKTHMLNAFDRAIDADVAQSGAFRHLKATALDLIDHTCERAIVLGVDETIAPTIGPLEYSKVCGPAFTVVMDAMTSQATQSISAQARIVAALSRKTNSVVLLDYVAIVSVTILAVALSVLFARSWVSNPIEAMASTMRALAAGDLGTTIEGMGRKDELGLMARALHVFRDDAARLRASEADRTELRLQQEAVVGMIANGLARLAKGDLTSRLDEVFASTYETLRADFNTTAESLRSAMGTIVLATAGINNGSEQIAAASDDLSRRTERQASHLEETSVALGVITESMMHMAENAREAANVAATTREAVETSGSVVQKAIDAMSQITESSNKIGTIIGVVDDIAFQTGLLALNASIEAAGAGDVGRGFAVVASEVRTLAKRTADAAQQIQELVQASSLQVENGVFLVDKTGVALKDIVVKVTEMDSLVGKISAWSQEQANSVAEINDAINQMDHVVQQNAAMVEESTAAAHALKAETQDLNALVGRFQLGKTPPGQAARGTGHLFGDNARKTPKQSTARPATLVRAAQTSAPTAMAYF